MAARTRPLILVVDDDPDIRALLEHDLAAAGYEVAEADGAMSARQRIEERSPDLIIADINMPQTSGIEFVASLREEPGKARIPVMYLTAHETDEELVHGTLGYPLLSKPVVAKELLALVKQQLRR
jgi:DNA-binding response OmpR family regulator